VCAYDPQSLANTVSYDHHSMLQISVILQSRFCTLRLEICMKHRSRKGCGVWHCLHDDVQCSEF
jgi:hypothetical protein